TITPQIIEGIISAQQLDGNGQPSASAISQHGSITWLVTESLVDVAGMVALDPFITAHGDVYRVQSMGFSDGGGPVARVEALIDSTQIPPRITMQRDLNELGRGYGRYQIWPMQQ